MDKSTFEGHLQEATQRVLAFTRQFVLDELPNQVLYLIDPNCSYDGNPLRFDEEVFPEDRLPEGQKNRPPANASDVIEFLWRGGKVPEWVNITVATTDTQYSYLFLLCCGRFTAEAGLYHRHEGIPPFHILGPPLPKTWPLQSNSDLKTTEERVAAHGKFRLPEITVHHSS